MKYLVLLFVLVGCNENKKLDSQLDKLDRASRSLQYSTFSLQCVNHLVNQDLSKEMMKLDLPRTKDAAYILIESKLYKCIGEKYHKLNEE